MVIAALGLVASIAIAVVTMFTATRFERVARTATYALAWTLAGCLGVVLVSVSATRGTQPAATAVAGLALVAVGGLLCLDRRAHQGGGVVRAAAASTGAFASRMIIVTVAALGGSTLGLYNGGVLEAADPTFSLVLEAVTPGAFDPAIRIRPAGRGDCTLGDARPTFEADRLVSCYVPHHWEVLGRRELSVPCPNGSEFQANQPVAVAAHDLAHDRWCLATSATNVLLTVPVCPVGLACTR